MVSDPSSRVRVLFVNENIGGHATVHNHLKTAFANHPRIEATFVDVGEPSLLRRIIGIRIPGLARLDLDLQSLRAQLSLSFWVRREIHRRAGTYDVLHVYTQNAALLVKARTPMVISTDTTNVHNAYRIPQRRSTRFTPITVALTKPIERRALHSCAAVVANSAWAHRSLTNDYGVPSEKLVTIPFGISGSSAPGTTSISAENPNTALTITFVGRQFRAKGGDVLLDAVSQLRANVHLLLVTTESVQTTHDVTIVSDLVQGDPRLWELLAKSSIFAFPSPIDQAPNAVLEAMAAGLPVVAVDTGAVAEMVVDGETGFLVRAGDSEGLAAALQTLVDDPALRSAFGAAGRRRFEERYDMAVATEALADLFESLVDVASVEDSDR